MKLLLVALLATAATLAQDIPGWRVNPEALQRSRLTFALDRQVVHSGRASLHVFPKPDANSGNEQLVLLQNIKADPYRGKHVRLSGYLRASGGSRATLWLRVDGPDGMIDLANMASSERAKAQVVKDSNEWRAVEQVVDVPKDAVGLAFGVMGDGPGQFWADSLKLDVVDQTVPLTGLGLVRSRERSQSAPKAQHRETLAKLRRLYQTASPEPQNLDFEEDKP